jgi:hypothetical protein
MPYEQRDNSGTLFVNDRKTDPKSSLPDRKGDGVINGQKVWISGWLKDGKNGTQFLSLSFTPKEEGGSNAQSSKPDSPSTGGAPF